MPLKLSAFLLFIILSISAIAQDSSYQNLLDSIIKVPSYFIDAKPIVEFFNSKEKFDIYRKYSKDDDRINKDTLAIYEFCYSFHGFDTTEWTDKELKNLIIVRDDSVKLEYVKSKFALKTDSLVEKYRLLINNYYHPKKVPIETYRYTRPLLTKDKKYAIIAYFKYVKGNIEGYGRLNLLKCSNGRWNILGMLDCVHTYRMCGGAKIIK